MWRNRFLTILFSGSVLLGWGLARDLVTQRHLAAAPPAATDAKANKDPTVDDDKRGKNGPAKAIGKTSPTDKDASDKGDPTPEKVVKTDAEWRKILTPLQFRVTRKKWTEPAGTGIYAHTKKDGIYHCICCGEPLFDSKTKFDSGTGWPSFFQPIDEKHITELEDTTDDMVRTEVQCSHCDAHLGHVFSDGPKPTGLRFCMNSASLRFVDRKKEHASKDSKSVNSKGAKKEPEGKSKEP